MTLRPLKTLSLLASTCLLLAGCKEEPASNRRILAKNVVLDAQASQKTGVSAAQAAQDSNVDPDLRVLASNVQLDNANNALESSNLQAALDDELAVGLATLLPGTTWSITNRAGDPEYNGSTGELTFNKDGTATLVSGKFAVIGMGHPGSSSDGGTISPNCTPTKMTYEVIGDTTIYLNVTVTASGTESSSSAVPVVAARKRDELLLVGSSGCGLTGEDRISVLTRKP
ncbi:hypothetical protein ATI61_101879 [Archangium gephyra]|uniref:Lipoprotein n=1 Tax=Archangium gephyra TaxID=48 RepID=A0AAC8QB05_9BACT|nr:hypothetical protein [Archangium gephyra]AKJ04025.1 Hypothetical protein AA314_05651 [Archangium gephyra]REG37890.1 hypothetical protein ATI61_101879 [Archangium gephyra]